ncbi:nitrate/nitrite transporter [Chloroflexota bacterium]
MKKTDRFYYGWLVVAVAFFTHSTWGISRYVFPYVLPTMEAELNLAHAQMGNIASVYFIAYTIMSFFWGIVADRIGPRKCMLIGQASIIVGLCGMGYMSSPAMGFFFYFLCGAGASGQSVPTVRLISDWFGGKHRGTALGIVLTGGGAIAMVLGAAVPAILASYSWQWTWWIGAAYIFTVAVLCWSLLVDTPAKKGLSYSDADNKKPSASSIEHVTGEHIVSRPTIRDILRKGTVWNMGGVYLAHAIGYTIFFNFAVAHLQEIGWELGAAAGVLAIWGAISIPGHIIWGLAADRLTKKYLLATTVALEAIGILIFLSGSTVGVYMGAVVISFGTVGIPTVVAASMADYYEATAVGRAYGFITLLFGVGAIIGPTLGGAIADATGTLYTAMLFGLGAVVLACILTFMLKKPPRQ